MKKEPPTNPTPSLPPAPSSDYKSRHKQGDARCGSSSFDWAVNLKALTVASEELSIKKATTAKFISQVCFVKNEMFCPATRDDQVESVFLMDLNISLLIKKQEESHLRRLMGKS